MKKKAAYIVISILLVLIVALAVHHSTLSKNSDEYQEFVSSDSAVTTVIGISVPKLTDETTSKAASIYSEKSDQDEIAGKYIEICKKYSTAGMSLAVFKGQDIIYTLSYGSADKAAGIPANKNTKFRIASISKTITGILAMQLVSEGKLNLDADISNYVGFKVRSSANPEIITTRQLLTHTSGMFDSASFDAATNQHFPPPLESVLKSNCFTGNKPGSTYLYSNFGAGIVSGIIEGAANERFYDYAKINLFDLLDLDAAYIRTQISDIDNIAQIYRGGSLSCNVKNRSTEERYKTIPIGQMYLIGQGDLLISAVDLAKFGIILAGDGTYNGIRVLPSENVNEMNKLQFQDSNVKRGLALSITDDIVSGRTMRGHPGQAYGMVSGLYYDTKDQTGIAFITNGCYVGKNDYGIYDINDAIIKYTYATFFPA